MAEIEPLFLSVDFIEVNCLTKFFKDDEIKFCQTITKFCQAIIKFCKAINCLAKSYRSNFRNSSCESVIISQNLEPSENMIQ